ncbi:MAG: sulfurtransferase [Gammaproteobacteria bacterium]|nr:MAG: sulfurtransferase [Gammaproteobacteria bacterium]
MPTTLVTTAELARHLDDPHWLLLDCRFDLADPGAGEAAWRAGHIPGALHADLDRDLSAPVTPATGRHPLPAPTDFAATLARWGVGPRTQVVAYDAGGGMIAARLWWMLRWLGHDAAAVLDGGLAAWVAAGGTLVTGAATARPPAGFAARPRPGMACDADEVRHALAAGAALVDLRAAERFSGEVEPLDPVAGHVPGAINLPFQLQLDAGNRLRPAAELASLWRERIGTRTGTELICMCGSGVTACHGLLALEVAGIRGARLYAGSWSEWIRDPQRPVASIYIRGGSAIVRAR